MKPPVNWPFRTFNGVQVPTPKPKKQPPQPKPVYEDAPF